MEIRDFDFGIKPCVTTPPKKNRKFAFTRYFAFTCYFAFTRFIEFKIKNLQNLPILSGN